MSNGVGFTVFQVPGSKAAKRTGGAVRFGSGGGGGTSAPSPANVIQSVGEPYANPGRLASSSSQGGGSSSSLNGRGQRNSASSFAAFQPGGLKQTSSLGQVQAVAAPYGGSAGSMGSVSSTGSGSNPNLSVPMGVSIGFQPGGARTADDERRGGVGWMRTGRVIRVKDTGDSFRFPLDEEHLPDIDVSEEQFEALKDKLRRVAEQHVNSSATWMENPTMNAQYRNQTWKPHLEKKNCVIYRQKEAVDNNLQRRAMLRAKLDTTLDQIEYAVQCDNTEDQRAYNAHCYQESFLDAAVLQVHERATAEDPFRFLGIKWLAYQSSVDTVFSCRDSLVVEFARSFKDAKGQRILVRVVQSINMKDYDGHERNFGFSRTTGTWVWLFRSMGPSSGKVDVSAIADNNFESGRNTPSWFANRVVTTMHTVALNHTNAADAKYLVRSRKITDKAWVPNSERPACSVCFKSFNLLRARHHCRVCAEIMCSACTVELGIQTSKLPSGMLPETGSTGVVSVEKFCLKCINKARTERLNAHLSGDVPTGSASLGDESYEENVPSAYAARASEVYYGQGRESASDHAAGDQGGNPQSQSFASVSSSSSTSSLGGGEKTGISYAGWSTKVLSAINREKPAEGGSKDRTLVSLSSSNSLNSNGSGNVGGNAGRSGGRQASGDRRRHNSDASGGSTSISSQSERGSNSVTEVNVGGRRVERDVVTGEIVLLDENDEVENITPLPTSFTKMEEQIAAQQALLRSMFIEGSRMMEQQHAYGAGQVHPVQQQRYLNQMPPPAPGRLDDPDSMALPTSTASIEYID